MTLDILEQVLNLIIGLVGLISAGITAYFAIKNAAKSFKEKTLNQNWITIISIADAAMKQAEESGMKGVDKKQMVVDSVKAGCNAAGIKIDGFLDQLSDYIDQAIKFANDLNRKTK